MSAASHKRPNYRAQRNDAMCHYATFRHAYSVITRRSRRRRSALPREPDLRSTMLAFGAVGTPGSRLGIETNCGMSEFLLYGTLATTEAVGTSSGTRRNPFDNTQPHCSEPEVNRARPWYPARLGGPSGTVARTAKFKLRHYQLFWSMRLLSICCLPFVAYGTSAHFAATSIKFPFSFLAYASTPMSRL
jgi:hypothetical protein